MKTVRLGSQARIGGITVESAVAILIATELWRENAESLVIYHVTDGKHMRGSLHYVGQAWDGSLPKRNPEKVITELGLRLGLDYDVVTEKAHVHVEYQPKTGINLDARRAGRKVTG